MPHSNILFTGEFSDSFESTKNFLEHCNEILNLFNRSEKILRKSRNILKNISYQNKEYTVKAFRVPTFPQNYSYGLFSNSKAKKSYLNGKKLLSLNILAPEPAGYFELRSNGTLKQSYYICDYQAKAQTLKKWWIDHKKDNDLLIKSFAYYCYQLHQEGILHRDFNALNILVSQQDKKWQFSLVDINRIRWSAPLTISQAMASLSRIALPESFQNEMLQYYSNASGIDFLTCKRHLDKEVSRTERYFRTKQKLRKIFPKK